MPAFVVGARVYMKGVCTWVRTALAVVTGTKGWVKEPRRKKRETETLTRKYVDLLHLDRLGHGRRAARIRPVARVVVVARRHRNLEAEAHPTRGCGTAGHTADVAHAEVGARGIGLRRHGVPAAQPAVHGPHGGEGSWRAGGTARVK